MPTVAIAVVNERNSEEMRQGYVLPVRIGRGAACNIQLDPENRAISRLHVEILEENGRIVLLNRALNQNATMFHGRSLAANEKVALEIGDSFRIFDYELKVLAPSTLGLLHVDKGSLRPRAEHPLVPGGAILAYGDAHHLTVEPVARLDRIDTQKIAGRLALLFYFDGDQPTFAVLSNPEGLQVFLDRGLVQQDALYIQALDTIEIGDHRFEIHPVGEPAIVCENPSCQVLNHYDRGENCRLCGTRLFGATRIVRGKI
ncbi:FHA domain-containing protein [Prosthecomicrobium sp. N25]|uniref:FHA domain-containing protein n=1 Tax=Prosthecomicrobium sp. N25 TaxID=3129254 RepID=UPI003077D79F